ncbi:hypothetical protein OG230_35985 [Streptomyces sp. NBC_00234]|nr:hypothetical protein [Streptomyces sp. NBC_00234]
MISDHNGPDPTIRTAYRADPMTTPALPHTQIPQIPQTTINPGDS